MKFKCSDCGIEISSIDNNQMCDDCYRGFLAENSDGWEYY